MLCCCTAIPHQLVGGLLGGGLWRLLGCCVAVLLSCCPAVLLRCFLVGLLWLCLTMPLRCCLVLFLLSCCVAALYTLKGDRVREGGWNTGLIIIPPSHHLTTPRLPTTPIHPTHHKYQETLKEKGGKVKKMTSKTWSKNDANSSKNGPGGARMHQKWSQNREKCAESPKVATRWLPRPLYPEGAIDF